MKSIFGYVLHLSPLVACILDELSPTIVSRSYNDRSTRGVHLFLVVEIRKNSLFE